MNSRLFLRALADLGLAADPVDWINATNAHIHSGWKRLIDSPLNLTVSGNGRLTIDDFSEPETSTDPRCRFLGEPHSSAQAAYWLFQELGQEVMNRLGVRNIEQDEELRRACFAEVLLPLDKANKAANEAGIPIQFIEGISAGEAWARQCDSGKVVGMDDPVWMEKAQDEIDVYLNQLFERTKGK